jgi:hypothetical protein
MEPQELITQAKRIASAKARGPSILAEALEFFRIYSGERSSFYKQLLNVGSNWTDNDIRNSAIDALLGYIRFIENGLSDNISFERRIQIDVVSDYLNQAQILINDKGIHPAVPCIIIGASLEEFLRNWVEELGLSDDLNKPSIDSYAKILREKEQISKQDIKDITSWTGLRNDAAHGRWENVNDFKQIKIMADGISLFIRKYSRL